MQKLALKIKKSIREIKKNIFPLMTYLIKRFEIKEKKMLDK